MPQQVRFLIESGALILDPFAGKGIPLSDDNKVLPDGGAPASGLEGPDFWLAFASETPFPPWLGNAAPATIPVPATITTSKVGNVQDIKLGVTLEVERTAENTCRIRGIRGLSATLSGDTSPVPGLFFYGAKAELKFGDVPWEVALSPLPPESRIARLRAFFGTFDIGSAPPGSAGESPPTLRLNAGGAYGFADASTDTRNALRADLAASLGSALDIVDISRLRVEFEGLRCSVSIRAEFRIKHLQGAGGNLEIFISKSLNEADSGKDAVQLTLRLEDGPSWIDPSGWFRIDAPRLTAVYIGNAFKLRVGGRVVFLPQRISQLSDTAKQWFGRLFEGMDSEFDSDFEGKMPSLKVTPPKPFRLQALELFDLSLPKLSLDLTDTGPIFTLEQMSLAIDKAGTTIRGSLPTIILKFENGQLSISSGPPTRISLQLSISSPSGVKVNGSLEYIESKTFTSIQGRCQLSSPAISRVDGTIRIARFRSDATQPWTPTFLIYLGKPVQIPVMPMVVIRYLAVGVGVNCHVDGVSHLDLAAARRRLQNGTLPDVSNPEVWIPSDTDLTLAVRAFLAPTANKSDDVFEAYAADVNMVLTSEAQLAVFGKLWLYTSISDAMKAEFQAKPSALGLMTLDAKLPSLVFVGRTASDGKSSLGGLGLGGSLLGFHSPPMQLAFEARPGSAALVLGPNDISGDLGPLKVRGSSLVAFRMVGDRFFALANASLAANFSIGGSASVSVVSLSARVSAGFSLNVALFAEIVSGATTLHLYGRAAATAYAAVSVHASVGFSITINYLFGSATISWSVEHEFELSIHADLDLEIGINTSGGAGLTGRARLVINVLGISAGLSLPLEANGTVVTDGRDKYSQVSQEIRSLIGV